MKTGVALFLAALGLVGCKKGDGQANAAGAKETLSALVKSGADQAALTTKLRPEPADYDEVFVGDAGKGFKDAVDPAWDGGKIVLKPAPEQTEIDVAGATPEQIQKGEGNAAACPGGYKTIADKLNPKVVIYCARFRKPGDSAGLSADALVYVNGHWAYFPKPFRAFN